MKSFFVSHGSFFLEVRQTPRSARIDEQVRAVRQENVDRGLIAVLDGALHEVSPPRFILPMRRRSRLLKELGADSGFRSISRTPSQQ